MTYLLMIIAGFWMADGIALLIAPTRMVGLLKESLVVAPSLLKWSWLTAAFGLVLLLEAQGLLYTPLWVIAGLMMIAKGVFIFSSKEGIRTSVVNWCLTREAIDYRFWGLGLCMLSLLLVNALGVLGGR